MLWAHECIRGGAGCCELMSASGGGAGCCRLMSA